MKVRDLIAKLQCFDEDQEVYVASPSGDYWGTLLALEVDNVETANVTYSEYHRTHKVVDDDHEDHYEKEELEEILLLS